MVLLIGGPGNSGKTYLADKLMQRLAVPYFCIDHLMMGIFRSDPSCGFTPTSPVEDISAKCIKAIFLCLSERYIDDNYEKIKRYRSAIERCDDVVE